MTPVPGGEITSTETWGLVPPATDETLDAAAVKAYEGMAETSAELDAAIVAADAEEATEEYLPDEENDQA
jgi:hypothetical protein